MKFSIIHIKELSGAKVQIYSLKYEGKEVSELQLFMYKFQDTHDQLIKQILQRIVLISQREGIQDSFFRRECKESNNIFRLMETEELRIYCIKFSNIILLFGSGGIKKYKTKKLSENPHLEKEVENLIKVENAINKKIKNGDLKITESSIEGDLEDLEL